MFTHNAIHNIERRRLLSAGLSAVALTAFSPALLRAAQQYTVTPRQTEGPFYPSNLPLDKDNNLVTVAGRPEKARGEIVDVVGQILDERGRPVARARIEIWQCDAFGRYHHPRDPRVNVPRDANFQGYGQYVTDSDGGYRFRTIKPVPYPGRAPHIHFIVSGPNFEPLTTQMYVAGAPENERDFLLNNIPNPKARQSLMVSFEPAVADGIQAVGRFDIVLAADGRFG